MQTAQVSSLISKYLHLLQDPSDPVTRTLTRDLPLTTGLHPLSVQAMTAAFAQGWSPAAVQRLDQLWQPFETIPMQRVAVVAPTNVPAALWQAVLGPLLAGAEVRLRPGSEDLHTAQQLIESLALFSPDLAARVELHAFAQADQAHWSALVEDCDVLAVHGSDQAVAAVFALAAARGFAGRMVGHGTLQSCAVVSAQYATDQALFAHIAPLLLGDALMADGRGCMSLRAIHVIGSLSPPAWQGLVDQLAHALAKVVKQLPAGTMAHAIQAQARLAVEEIEFAAALQGRAATVHSVGDARLLAQQDGPVRCSELGPAARVLAVYGYPSENEWLQAVAPWRNRLGVVAVAGSFAPDLFDRAGVHRLCAPGQMQAPPLDRAAEGRLPLSDYLRVVDRRISL